MKNRSLDHRNDWCTPLKEYTIWAEKYEFSDFDPCPIWNDIEEFDGTKADWPDRTFCNPPYDLDSKTAFVKAAIRNAIQGRSSCLLLPVSTSTRLFQECLLPTCSITFVAGRLKFEGVNTKGQWVNPRTGKQAHPAGHDDLEQVSGCGMHDSMLCFFGDW